MITTRDYTEPPTALDVALSAFQRTTITESVGTVHPFSVRIPTIEFATLEALSRFSGVSRNKTLVMLLAVGMSEVFQGMDSDSLEGVYAMRREVFGTLKVANLETSTEGEI